MRKLLFTALLFPILISACNAAPQVLPTAIVIVVTPTALPPTPVIIVITATSGTSGIAPLPTLITLATNPPQQITQVAQPTQAAPVPTATTPPQIQPTAAIPTVKPSNTAIVSAPVPTPYNNNIPAVFGPHQNGFFIYLSDRKEIWAFLGPNAAPIATPTIPLGTTPTPIPNGPWLKFADPFKPGVDLDSDPSIAAPPGLLQPKGGFGKIWRTNTTVKTALGWAADWERGYIVNITDYYTRTGTQLILQHIVTVPDGTNYFVDESKGTWEIRR